MKKMLITAVMAGLLAGSLPALAAVNTYTDADSGFKVKTQAAWMELGGKDFYGLAVKPEEGTASLNLVCAIPAARVEEAIGRKFTTSEFMKKFADLQVLERYQINADKVEYPLFKPETYEIRTEEADKKSKSHKDDTKAEDDGKGKKNTEDKAAGSGNNPQTNALALIPSKFLEHSSVGISTGKTGRQPYVYLHFVDKGESGEDTLKKLRRPTDVQLAITSANDMLYAVLSTFPLPNLTAQKKRVEEATVFSRKKLRDTINEGNVARVNEYIASRKAFLKGLTFFTPVKDTQPFGFDDERLGGRVPLPENWAYCQVNEEEKSENITIKLTLSAPWNGLTELVTRQQELEKAADLQKFTEINYQNFKEALIFSSAQAQSKDSLGDLFAEPLLTQLVIEKLIQGALHHPKVKEFADLENIKTSTDFNADFGTVKVAGSGSIRNKFPFAINMNALFTPQRFGLGVHIAKSEKDFSPEIADIVKNVTLVREK